MTTAAVVIIGNEILTGKFADENGPYLIRRLRELGVSLQRLVVVPDVIPVIAAEIRVCSDGFEHVFTTGGVGPTHDDVTLMAVAQAFGLELERRERLMGLLLGYGLPDNEATLRMATVPAGSVLLETGDGRYPTLKVRNVYVFPGVPPLFRHKFEELAPRLACQPVAEARLYTREQETDIAAELTRVAGAHPSVDIGSYPRFDDPAYRVIITFESADRLALESAVAALRAAIPTVDV